MANELYKVVVGKFVKECLSVPYERVFEKIMCSGFYHTSIDIPPCLLDE